VLKSEFLDEGNWYLHSQRRLFKELKGIIILANSFFILKKIVINLIEVHAFTQLRLTEVRWLIHEAV